MTLPKRMLVTRFNARAKSWGGLVTSFSFYTLLSRLILRELRKVISIDKSEYPIEFTYIEDRTVYNPIKVGYNLSLMRFESKICDGIVEVKYRGLISEGGDFVRILIFPKEWKKDKVTFT